MEEELKTQHPGNAVLEHNGQIIGFLFMRTQGDDWEITSMAVDQGHRKQGFGAVLVAHGVETAKKNGAPRVLLEVSAKNPIASRLYERFGFTKGRVRKAYYSDGSDAVEMSLTIALA